jgi:hypothetical protein
MTDNTALFLVQSPLHIQNAIEAIAKFGISKSTFLVVTSKHNAKWAEMMIAALPVNTESVFCERNDFDLEGCTKDYAQHIPYLKRQAFDLVFFSDSRLYIFIDIVNSLQNKNTYLMDDGTGMIQTIASLEHTGKYFDITQSSQPERRKQIELIKKKYKLWQLEPIKYDLFTAFDFSSCALFNVVENPMKRLSCSHPNLSAKDVLILGQPFVSHQYMENDAYIHCLARIIGHYKGKKINYLPHPRENHEHLTEIANEFAINIVETNVSAEQYLMQMEQPPRLVCGFNSAALWYIAKFQPDIKVEAHRLKHDDIALSGAQLMLRSSHLSIIDINQLVYDYFRLRMNVIEA